FGRAVPTLRGGKSVRARPNTGGALREGLSQHYEAENECKPAPNAPYALASPLLRGTGGGSRPNLI
ncbi:hypothetical protein, partial [Moorena sp. SIO2C4]|uniref:hypothetical protein n=1 Tax=Moorena sp. SIO2C4 TaxID=2607824 RepID=UPI00257EFF0A